MVQITHVRVPEGVTHESQASGVRWYDPQSGNVNVANITGMVEFIRNGGRAYICDGSKIVDVVVANHPVPHIAPAGGGSLLALPKF
jgi:hypothetical protein